LQVIINFQCAPWHRHLVVIQGMYFRGTPQLPVAVVIIRNGNLPGIFIDIENPLSFYIRKIARAGTDPQPPFRPCRLNGHYGAAVIHETKLNTECDLLFNAIRNQRICSKCGE